jgi:hypothetical protein
MPTAPLPPFIRTPGDIVGSPPYRATGCLMQAMFLSGSRTAQQSFCDAVLNRPSGGSLVFHAVTDQVLVTAIYADTMSSTDPIDASKGVMQEWDVGFWTAVHGGPVGAEDDWKTYWLPSYLFVDSPAAMAAGREVYGYPKTTAAFEARGQDHSDPTVTLVVQHFPVFGPNQRPVTGPLVKIGAGAPGVAAPDLASSVATAWSLLDKLEDPMPLEQDGFHLPPLPSLSMPQILFRQARDPVTIGRASVQSVLYVAAKLLKVTGVGLLHSPTTVELMPSASHPIMETLGLRSTQVAELGFWITQDFEVGAAQPLFSA